MIPKKTVLVFSFFLFVYLAMFFTGYVDAHHFVFQDWIKGNFDDNLYLYPAIKYFGSFGYGFFGELFFLVFPLIMFFASIALLSWFFSGFGLNQLFIPLLFLLNLKTISYLAFFTRENIFFPLACIYSVAFCFILYKKQRVWSNWFFLFSSNALMFLFRELAVVFLVLTIFLVFYLNVKRFRFVFPTIFSAAPFFQTGKNLSDMFNFSLSAPFFFKPKNIFAFTLSPIFTISLFIGVFKRDIFHLLLLILTILYLFAAVTTIGFNDVVIRYASGLIPLHLFYIAKSVKKEDDLKTKTTK